LYRAFVNLYCIGQHNEEHHTASLRKTVDFDLCAEFARVHWTENDRVVLAPPANLKDRDRITVVY